MSTLTFEEIKTLFLETREQIRETREQMRETDKKFQETDKKFQDTDKKFQDTDKKFLETDKKFLETDRKFEETSILVKNLSQELGGIGKSLGQIAEDFFYTAVKSTFKVGKMEFDYIDRNLLRETRTLKGEYDIILYNHYKVLIIEVKHNFRKKNLATFYKNLKNFKALFPNYKNYKVYGAIAFMTCEEGVQEEASDYGYFILSANNDKFQIINESDFEPNEIK